jgi:DNA-directed RNA polymerase specialized sigma24 family protein
VAKPTMYGSSETSDLTNIALDILADLCTQEREKFRYGLASDSRYAYELFRRALYECNEHAWQVLYQQYASLVEHWIQRNGAFRNSLEQSETLVSEAFTRFWHAIPPERFASFPNTASLLHYLHICAGSVVIDNVRSSNRFLPTDQWTHNHVPQVAPDEEVLERMNQQELWSYITTLLKSEAEYVVMFDSFVNGLKPRDICARHRELFSHVKDVYMIKQNVLARLSRDRRLRELLAS